MTTVQVKPGAASTHALGMGAALVVTMLCLSWGFNQVAVKLALPELPPMLQATIRSIGGALVVALAARLRGVPLFVRDGTLRVGLLIGVLFGFEFVMIYRGLMWTTASRAVVFLYAAPFFVVAGARWLLKERLNASQWSGLALSFLGVMLAIGVPQPDVDAKVVLGDLMLLAASAGWAGATLAVKATRLARIAAERTLAYQLVVSVPILGLASWATGESVAAMPGPLALGSLAYQALWVVGITYLIWFQMVKTYSASRLSAFTFMTPLFGVIAGHVVLGEPLTLVFAAAVALVLAGLVLVNRPG